MKRSVWAFLVIPFCLLGLAACEAPMFPLLFLDPEVSIDYLTGASGGNITYSITIYANPSTPYTGVTRGDWRFEYRVNEIAVTNLTQTTYLMPNPNNWQWDGGMSASATFDTLINGSAGVVDIGDVIYFSVEGQIIYSFSDKGMGTYWFHKTQSIVAY